MTIFSSTKSAVYGFTIDGHVNNAPSTSATGGVSHTESFSASFFLIPGPDFGQYSSLNIDGQRFTYSSNHSDNQKNIYTDPQGNHFRIDEAFKTELTMTFKDTNGATHIETGVDAHGLVMTAIDASGVELANTSPVTYYFPLSTYENTTAFQNYELQSANVTYASEYGNNYYMDAMSTTQTAIATASCFAKGTKILTERGHVAIENLVVGDKVITLEHGAQPILWVGHQTICGLGKNAPIVFCQRDNAPLILSPLHRVYQSHSYANYIVGEESFLICAKDLINHDTIYRSPRANITYYHILLDRHEVICANGIWSESLSLSAQTDVFSINDMILELHKSDLVLQKIIARHQQITLPWVTSHEAAVIENLRPNLQLDISREAPMNLAISARA